MLEVSRTYGLRLEKIIVPMAKGDRSKRVLGLSFLLARKFNSEITALTVKDSRREITWSDKVAVVTRAYRDGKRDGLNVVPKVKSARGIKEGIIEELNSRNYDIAMMAVERRAFLSSSVLGSIGDFVFKHSRTTVAAFSIRNATFDYGRIMVPLSEQITTRTALSFALALKVSTGSELVLLDLRKFDKKPVHGFKLVFEQFDEFVQRFGPGIGIIKPVIGGNALSQTVLSAAHGSKPSLIVMGPSIQQGRPLRINSIMNSITKLSPCDVALVKK